jgi:hypothetical protein
VHASYRPDPASPALEPVVRAALEFTGTHKKNRSRARKIF